MFETSQKFEPRKNKLGIPTPDKFRKPYAEQERGQGSVRIVRLGQVGVVRLVPQELLAY